jgi:hypothetical protein
MSALYVPFVCPLCVSPVAVGEGGGGAGLQDEVGDGGRADVLDFVPGEAGAGEGAAGRQLHFAAAAGVGEPHSAARQGVAEVRGVEVPLVPLPGCEGAAQGAQGVVLVQQFADRATPPSGSQRVGEGRLRGRRALGRRVG